jgi:hypothetical protein
LVCWDFWLPRTNKSALSEGDLWLPQHADPNHWFHYERSVKVYN